MNLHYPSTEQKAREARFDGSKGLKCKSLTRSVKPEWTYNLLCKWAQESGKDKLNE